MNLEYQLQGAGWAVCTVKQGPNSCDMTVSYLENSLRQLAEAACGIAEGAAKRSVYFFDEPGEHELALERRSDGRLEYEIRWRSDWSSWNMGQKERYELRLKGSCSVSEFTSAVLEVLHQIFQNVGPEKYLEEWIEHPFPLASMRRLERLLG